MKIILSAKAEKNLKRFSRIDQIILSKKIRQLKETHIAQEEKIKGFQSIYRVRVGNYRMVYKKNSKEIYIILIAHRKDVYNLLKQLL